WKFDQHVGDLLHAIRLLMRSRPAFMLLTCHTPGIGPAELTRRVANAAFETSPANVLAKHLVLETRAGQRLDSGMVARWRPSP
ncbi:MAG: hypothetical protein R6U98_34705, partial [Pirellulaceae bacterium]